MELNPEEAVSLAFTDKEGKPLESNPLIEALRPVVISDRINNVRIIRHIHTALKRWNNDKLLSNVAKEKNILETDLWREVILPTVAFSKIFYHFQKEIGSEEADKEETNQYVMCCFLNVKRGYLLGSILERQALRYFANYLSVKAIAERISEIRSIFKTKFKPQDDLKKIFAGLLENKKLASIGIKDAHFVLYIAGRLKMEEWQEEFRELYLKEKRQSGKNVSRKDFKLAGKNLKLDVPLDEKLETELAKLPMSSTSSKFDSEITEISKIFRNLLNQNDIVSVDF
ncbi:hypothetical protein FAI40_03825 [Acetobacteraceae bacterium]|nr:hypothetical protein FAI40_03825 [Acetobacteraceae bacterium]